MSRRATAATLTLLLTAATISCGAATAQDARVRTTLSSDDPVWVGQQVTLIVELLAPGYFASAASFDLPDPEGVLLMPPEDHPVVGSETIDGTRYTVQRHKLTAWPMRAGDQAIPALTARFSFKRQPLDNDAEAASVTTAPIPFTVRIPPGAEHLGTVISARDLTVEETWEPTPGTEDIAAGAAFTRTITFTAPDVPGMVFPPFPASPIDGVGVYAKRHLVDQSHRGALTGARRDVITYVCQRPGQFVIPASRFTWFDIDAQQLRTEDLPARTLNVVANPAMAQADAPPASVVALDPRTWGRLAGALALVLAAVAAARSATVRRLVGRGIAAFRPVHLQPLNPGAKDVREHQCAATRRAGSHRRHGARTAPLPRSSR